MSHDRCFTGCTARQDTQSMATAVRTEFQFGVFSVYFQSICLLYYSIYSHLLMLSSSSFEEEIIICSLSHSQAASRYANRRLFWSKPALQSSVSSTDEVAHSLPVTTQSLSAL